MTAVPITNQSIHFSVLCDWSQCHPPYVTQHRPKLIVNLEFPWKQVKLFDQSDSHIHLSQYIMVFLIFLLVTVQNSQRISAHPPAHILKDTFYLQNQSACCKPRFLKIYSQSQCVGTSFWKWGKNVTVALRRYGNVHG